MAVISEFYKRLRDLCEERNMTVNELVRVLNLSSGSPTAWKSGAAPRLATVKKIADFFQVSADYLLGNVSDPFFHLDTKRILREINSYDETENAPTAAGERSVTDDDIKFALFGGDGEITDEMYDEVRNFAAFIKRREEEKKRKD